MWYKNIIILFALVYPATSEISCQVEAECSLVEGSSCVGGVCSCPIGQQINIGGTRCIDMAPYYMSQCLEENQCSRLVAQYECSYHNASSANVCQCRSGHHYLYGRCWRSLNVDDACSRNEECAGLLRDPHALACVGGVCVCSEGYYLRQRGECRRRGLAVGDGCVIDHDCQFEGGACDINTFTCYDINSEISENRERADVQDTQTSARETVASSRQHGITCSASAPCVYPFVCSSFGACICPTGFYADNQGQCMAELNTASTVEQCTGILAQVIDGLCTCPANFYYDYNMRDCVKVVRRIADVCVLDEQCWTFGAFARCGPPQGLFGARTCECDTDEATWDEAEQLCVKFSGLGEECVEDRDCRAGNVQGVCVLDGTTAGYCACPDGYQAVGELCLTTGLGLGDSCSVDVECTAIDHLVCDGECVCGGDYREENGTCSPSLGGICALDEDCGIEHTVCVEEADQFRCRCDDEHAPHEELCWPVSEGYQSSCNVSAQCIQVLGDNSVCDDGNCTCTAGHHYRDGKCWAQKGLFEQCSRISDCFLGEITERTTCRNGFCQCRFEYPYSDELSTCLPSSSTSVLGSISVILLAFLVLTLK